MRGTQDPDDLVAASHRSFVGSFRKMVEHSPEGEILEIGSVLGFVTGLPLGLFNGVVAVARAAERDLDEAIDWAAERGYPYRVRIAGPLDAALGGVALAKELERDDWAEPGMILRAPPPSPPPAAGVTVTPVSDEDGLVALHEATLASGLSSDLSARVFSESLVADPDVQAFAVALEGRPVGTSLAIRTGDVAGVYAVGTAEPARRRGVGSAATWAAVDAARAWGCGTVALQASAMGYPIYSAMGFRRVVAYATYRPPLRPA